MNPALPPEDAGRAGPLVVAERVDVLDVLRGVALFGVFLANFIGFAGPGLMATNLQLYALPTVAFDKTLTLVLEWLVFDKANTLFAFLFGLGFYLQMQRLEARGADFQRIYLRRLTVLLMLGVAHLLLLWTWDILHLYAIAGFALFALRRLDDRRLLYWGLGLAVFGRLGFEAIKYAFGLDDWHGLPSPYDDEAVFARQQLASSGDYLGLVRHFAMTNLSAWLLNGLVIGWLLYALGRFLLGAWVGRRGWLQRSGDYLPGFRRVARHALLWGLLAEGLALLVAYYGSTDRLAGGDAWVAVGEVLHLVSVPVLAAGYLCVIVVGWHGSARRWLEAFASVGRMALTNYVMQSLCYAFVLFGAGPGLALGGKVGASAVLGIVIVGYALQVAFSRWWLGRYRFGPLEWVWRALTYGEAPAMRRRAADRKPGEG